MVFKIKKIRIEASKKVRYPWKGSNLVIPQEKAIRNKAQADIQIENLVKSMLFFTQFFHKFIHKC